MKALILAGGEGTRLRPLTYERPKVLIPTLNQPLMEYTLNRLHRHGVDDIILAVGHMADAIQAHFGDGNRWNVRLDYSVESEPLGSGGAIKNVARLLKEDTFIVLNGDIYTDLDVTAMLDFHRHKKAMVTISLTEVADPSAYGVVDMAEDGRLRRFVEKPPPGQAPSNLVNAGTWIFEPGALAYLPEGVSSVEYNLFPLLLANGKPMYGYASDAYWMDVGTPERYMRLTQDLLAGRPPDVAPDVQLHPSSLIDGPIMIGRDCRIEANVRIIGPAVLGDGCIIRAGSTIEGCVLWDNVHIGRSVRLRHCILASNCDVSDGTEMVGEVLISGTYSPR